MGIPAIKDEFMGKGTPQKRYRWRMAVSGKCIDCGKATDGAVRCEAHLEINRLAKAKKGR